MLPRYVEVPSRPIIRSPPSPVIPHYRNQTGIISSDPFLVEEWLKIFWGEIEEKIKDLRNFDETL
jgi:hypothetical protein